MCVCVYIFFSKNYEYCKTGASDIRASIFRFLRDGSRLFS